MYLHANAKLGLAGRLALVQSIAGGCSIREAAARFRAPGPTPGPRPDESVDGVGASTLLFRVRAHARVRTGRAAVGSPRLLEVTPSGRGQASPPAHGVLRATPDFAA